jgi:bifunctional DNase/RNase
MTAIRALALGLLLIAIQTADTRAGTESPPPAGAQEVDVLAVVQDQRTLMPTVVLESKRDRRHLVMVIGPAEATSIAVPLQGVTPPRPLTHDLFLTLFGRLDATLTRVVINDLRDGIYFATVHLIARGGPLALDARPSDAIALAIRAKVPVFVEDRVFSKSDPPAAPRKSPSI